MSARYDSKILANIVKKIELLRSEQAHTPAQRKQRTEHVRYIVRYRDGKDGKEALSEGESAEIARLSGGTSWEELIKTHEEASAENKKGASAKNNKKRQAAGTSAAKASAARALEKEQESKDKIK